FSSRRRHTRWPRDWSSDVCSSDLAATGQDSFDCNAVSPVESYSPGLRNRLPIHVATFTVTAFATNFQRCPRLVTASAGLVQSSRSEERRVGKECTARWERVT